MDVAQRQPVVSMEFYMNRKFFKPAGFIGCSDAFNGRLRTRFRHHNIDQLARGYRWSAGADRGNYLVDPVRLVGWFPLDLKLSQD